ncbi:hypothetical protein [Tuwongella immobilis]|uniref:Leucine-binding protein domain-containing protein n=1 Tax=Tuwongella immobilis TaxID=692036 RepID=A0A6C2YPR1_9BACT|nr:hypothetical protein [Tuwongella immobilis]VIP03446.1 unnamed protein product [Tuwongella immobilis]VTS04264.1 unnamed protein product [Tuwongella immobilis]
MVSKRWLNRLVVLVGVVLLQSGCQRTTRLEPLWVGQLTPAERSRESIELVRQFVEQTNAAAEPVIPGHRLQVIHAQVDASLDTFSGQTSRLSAVNRVAMIFGGDTAMQAEKIRIGDTTEPILLLTAAGSSGPVPPLNRFHLGIAPIERGRMIALDLRDRLKPNRALLLRDANPHHQPIWDTLERGLLDSSIAWEVLPSDAPTTTRMARMQAVPEQSLVVIVGDTSMLTKLREEFPKEKRGNLSVFFVGEDAESASWRSQFRDFPVTLFCLSAVPVTPTTTVATQLLEAVNKQAIRSISPQDWLHLESLKIWTDLVHQKKSSQYGVLREQLLKAEALEGVTGKLRFGKNQQVFRAGFVIELRSDGDQSRATIDPPPLPPAPSSPAQK